MESLKTHFSEIWMLDFEFKQDKGGFPDPICLVAEEYFTRKRLSLWQDQLRELKSPPFNIGTGSLFVAYYSIAELSCFLKLGWTLPRNIFDLFAEFRCLTNGLDTKLGNSLIGALSYFGFDSIGQAEKEGMRALAIRGGPWTGDEKVALLRYCSSDVDALKRLLPVVLRKTNLFQALHRGRFMKAAAKIEENGIPIDTGSLSLLTDRWESIQEKLIEEIDYGYGIYEGSTFKVERWANWLRKENKAWPLLPSGNLDLKDETFKNMALKDQSIAPIYALRSTLGKMRLADLSMGPDGRNRSSLSVFRSITGRNQPSSSSFIFGPSVWLRSLVKPAEGCGLAYIDWTQQEFGIAAALSNDESMMSAYHSGDCYLTFAKQAGAVPQNATKESHPVIRDQFKGCVLAVQYGMGRDSLALRLGLSVARAGELLRLHKEVYKTFWRWSDGALDYFMTRGELRTPFGWALHLPKSTRHETNPRSVRNFPIQATGAEILRLACCYAVESGVKVCAPVHDALLIEADLEKLDQSISETQAAMKTAGKRILQGFELRSDVKVFKSPERYFDPRGKDMWDRVVALAKEHNPRTGYQLGLPVGGGFATVG